MRKDEYKDFAERVAKNLVKLEIKWSEGNTKIIKEIDHENEILKYLIGSFYNMVELNESIEEDGSMGNLVKGTD